jgi:hypothetical protein
MTKHDPLADGDDVDKLAAALRASTLADREPLRWRIAGAVYVTVKWLLILFLIIGVIEVLASGKPPSPFASEPHRTPAERHYYENLECWGCEPAEQHV